MTAFLDILGYTELIKGAFKQGRGQEELARLRDALDTAYAFLKEQSKELWLDGKLRFQLRSFSDCLMIGHPITVNDGGLGVLMMMISYVAYIQAELAQKGYFVRGGIAVGDLYVDEDIIFGPALLEAYEAEQKVASVPRVVLCESAKAVYLERQVGGFSFSAPDLLRDTDGQIFVDYLDATVMIAYPDDRPFDEILERQKDAVSAKLEEHKTNPKIWAKYQWLANYHNAFCERHSSVIGADKVISSELLRSRPTPWTVA